MKRASLLAVACAALGALTVISSAAADYNAPREAKAIDTDMVTAYNPCTAPSLTHRPGLANPACPPVQSSANNPANIYTFGQYAPGGSDYGSASIELKYGRGDVKFYVRSRAIWKNGAPYNGSDLAATAIIRATDNGCGALFDVDCTIVDFPFPVGLTCTLGYCRAIAPTANGVLPGAIHEGDKSTIDVGQIAIRDEDGDTFARQGVFPGRTTASAAFNAPRSAYKAEASMVPAHNQCTAPTLTHRPSLALPACPPVQSSANNPTNTYTFGQRSGRDDGSANVRILRDFGGNVKISVRSHSIWKNGALYSGNDLAVTAAIRATDNGCGVDPYDIDCTQVDFPFPVGLSCTTGYCKSASPSWNAVVPEAVHADDKSNIEIGQISIRDEDGDPVARQGLFVL